MCGRYRLSRKKQIIEEYFDSAPWDEEWIPRYNIAPTQSVPVVRQNPKNNVRELSLMRWGLIPHWAKDSSIAMSTINAKSETAATKPAFRDPLRFRRCLCTVNPSKHKGRQSSQSNSVWLRRRTGTGGSRIPLHGVKAVVEAEEHEPFPFGSWR